LFFGFAAGSREASPASFKRLAMRVLPCSLSVAFFFQASDDAADVREAMACADRGEFLSPAATEAFMKWMQGNGDESWRDELE
jgi:hypothetical protein